MKKIKYIVEIEMGNDAMQTKYDLGFALRRLAYQIECGPPYGILECVIKDTNGNVVGEAKLTEKEENT